MQCPSIFFAQNLTWFRSSRETTPIFVESDSAMRFRAAIICSGALNSVAKGKRSLAKPRKSSARLTDKSSPGLSRPARSNCRNILVNLSSRLSGGGVLATSLFITQQFRTAALLLCSSSSISFAKVQALALPNSATLLCSITPRSGAAARIVSAT